MGNFPSTLKTKRILQTRLPLRLWELRLIHRGVQLLIKNFTQSKEPSYINSPFLRSTGLSFLSTLLPFLLIKYTALLSALLPFLVPLLTSVIDYLTSFLSTDYLNKKPSFKASQWSLLLLGYANSTLHFPGYPTSTRHPILRFRRAAL